MKTESRHRCPYCGYLYQSEAARNLFSHLLSDSEQKVAVHAQIRICPHIDCGKAEVSVDVGGFPAQLREKTQAERDNIRFELPGSIFHRRILPSENCGKAQFKTAKVPEVIFKDYNEACKLLDISPCASASFSRRCLHNMIRARFKIKAGKLQGEINALSSLSPPVNQEIIEALEYVRKLARVNALPEDDIKMVRDVTDAIAKRMIDIIEILLLEFFIAPAERGERLLNLKAILGIEPK